MNVSTFKETNSMQARCNTPACKEVAKSWISNTLPTVSLLRASCSHRPLRSVYTSNEEQRSKYHRNGEIFGEKKKKKKTERAMKSWVERKHERGKGHGAYLRKER
jgi:hypothetical protein